MMLTNSKSFVNPKAGSVQGDTFAQFYVEIEV